MTKLRRIDPADAEDLDDATKVLLNRWAARKLDIADDQVATVLVEVTGGCGEGTCEFTTARAEVDLSDGRVFLGPEQGFGLFIRDIVDMDVSPDGTERRPGDMWDLYSEDGKKVAPKPEAPARPVPPKTTTLREPEPGVSIRVTQEIADLRGGRSVGGSRRTEVYTAHGWADLREVVAAYDANRPDGFG